MEDVKYIKCNYCNRKYVHDDDNIKDNFGYKKNGDYYKTCLKCKDRRKEVQRMNYELNKDDIKIRQKLYREEHKDIIQDRDRKYREENKGILKIWRTKYNVENKDRIKEQAKKYRELNKDVINEKCNQRRREKKEKLREEAENSNGALICCGRCIKLKPIEACTFPNGKVYNLCMMCAKVKIDS